MKDLTSFVREKKNPLIVILGQTASGKTALSVKIAKDLNGEIIGADSRQIYKEMPIATAVATKEEKDGLPHRVLEFLSPNQNFTLAQYKNLALKTAKEILKRKAVPMLVGGTGLYISALIENYEIPKVPPDKLFRERQETLAEKHGTQFIHDKLKKLDPVLAEKIHPNNLHYIIRALEINRAVKQNRPNKKGTPFFSTFLIGIKYPREELYERINKRVDIMVENGLVSEVKKLLEKGYDEKLPAMSSVGVKEIIPYIKGEVSLVDALETLKRNTRRYAKRQMTWFKRYDNIIWITPKKLKNVLAGEKMDNQR